MASERITSPWPGMNCLNSVGQLSLTPLKNSDRASGESNCISKPITFAPAKDKLSMTLAQISPLG